MPKAMRIHRQARTYLQSKPCVPSDWAQLVLNIRITITEHGEINANFKIQIPSHSTLIHFLSHDSVNYFYTLGFLSFRLRFIPWRSLGTRSIMRVTVEQNCSHFTESDGEGPDIRLSMD